MKRILKKYKLIGLITILFSISTFITIQHTKATEGDAGGSINPVGSGCGGQNACWEFHGSSDVVQGIRITVVNSTGQMVSARSKDYLNDSTHANLFNKNQNYYRCINNNRNRISYLKGYSSCNWSKHDGSSIIKYSSWLPSIFFDNAAAGTLKNKIIGMSEEELKNGFFSDIGYTVPNSASERENHYLIVEPLTAVTIKGYGTYYGTYQELASKWRGVSKASYISSVINTHVPLSIFVEGNSEIKGPGGFNNNSYFNGALKTVNKNSPYTSTYYSNGKKVARVANNYFGFENGFGIGIFWIPQLNTTPPKCDYNNSAHFNSTTSGPNGEDCCQYVLNNLSEYSVNQSQLFSKYPRCRANIVNKCNFNLSITKPSCGSSGYGKIEDISDWNCIYASPYSTDSTIKNYFLKYGSTTSKCSVYCRNTLEYHYPGSGMVALAGNYFTIGNSISSYSTYVDSSTDLTKVRAAILGPVKVSITKQCSILGESTAVCEQKRDEELNKIDNTSPQVEFSYESDYYNNPVETLKSSKLSSSTNTNGSIKTKQTTYTYSLKDNTYKFVTKNTGISYKTASSAGSYPYINIGPHLPIHFSEIDDTINFQITIKRFNLPNFDRLVLNGQTVSTKFVTSIETYIQNLINEGRVNPKNINGLYYLDQSFIDLLKKNNYDATSFLQMSCANTNSYTCGSNNFGIYCYDKGTYTNSESTYNVLKSCIKTKVDSLTSQKASYKNDMLYSCNFSSEGYTDDSNDPSGINVIFRPISLNNPFPGKTGNGRNTGYNWCYGNNCTNTNSMVKAIITKNRSVQTEKIYKDLDPLYTITLNPGVIKSIRNYNDNHKYDDFKLTCNNGNKCLSKFIRNEFKNYFNGCGISGKTAGLNCTRNDTW